MKTMYAGATFRPIKINAVQTLDRSMVVGVLRKTSKPASKETRARELMKKIQKADFSAETAYKLFVLDSK